MPYVKDLTILIFLMATMLLISSLFLVRSRAFETIPMEFGRTKQNKLDCGSWLPPACQSLSGARTGSKRTKLKMGVSKGEWLGEKC